MRYLPIYIICLLQLLTACEKSSVYHGPVPDYSLVVYSFVQPDSLISIQLSKTRYMESDGVQLEEVSGEVLVNGERKGNVEYAVDKGYYANVYPRPGDRVRLIVRAKGLKEVSGKAVLPVEGIKVSVDSSLLDAGGKLSKVYYNIRIDDTAQERHYYRLVIATETYQEVNGVMMNYHVEYSYNTENNPLLSGGNNYWLDGEDMNKYRIFNNESFEGKGYTMRVSVNARNTEEIEYSRDGETVFQRNVMRHRVKLIRLDESSYLYFKSVMLLDQGEGIIEPVQVHSNVSGGVGIVGYAYPTETLFEMPVTKMNNENNN